MFYITNDSFSIRNDAQIDLASCDRSAGSEPHAAHRALHPENTHGTAAARGGGTFGNRPAHYPDLAKIVDEPAAGLALHEGDERPGG